MNSDNKHPSRISIILSIGLLLSLILACSQSINSNSDQNSSTIVYPNTDTKNDKSEEEKQKGAHIFGHLDSTNLQPFIQNNYEWITLVAWAGQKDFDSPTMAYYRGNDSLRNVRRDARWKRQIKLVHEAGFKVLLKPHIWIDEPSAGKWRSDIYPANEENWKLWQKSYRDYLLHYAHIAAENEVELFCIGTELTRLSVEKSDFWRALIQEVRSIYSGKITYAANWYKEYEKITFWDALDYIGIQAYFPLTKNNSPSVKQISKGWEKHLPTIESISKKHNRKILFTEMGYKSTADSAVEPWLWIEHVSDQKRSLSLETQANCYEAFFSSVWNKEWFAGVHIWQLRSDYPAYKEELSLDFTPQGKPAEMVIANGFE